MVTDHPEEEGSGLCLQEDEESGCGKRRKQDFEHFLFFFSLRLESYENFFLMNT